jgi:hypothetical protein
MYVCMYIEDLSAFKTLILRMYVCMYVCRYVCMLCSQYDEFLSQVACKAVHFIHRQRRCITMHVEFEDRDWMNAFNLFLSLSALFEHLFVWFSSESSIKPLETKVTSATKLTPR